MTIAAYVQCSPFFFVRPVYMKEKLTWTEIAYCAIHPSFVLRLAYFPLFFMVNLPKNVFYLELNWLTLPVAIDCGTEDILAVKILTNIIRPDGPARF